MVVGQFKKSSMCVGLTKLFLYIYGQPDEMGPDWTHRSKAKPKRLNLGLGRAQAFKNTGKK